MCAQFKGIAQISFRIIVLPMPNHTAPNGTLAGDSGEDGSMLTKSSKAACIKKRGKHGIIWRKLLPPTLLYL
eukprot:6286060-Amphidinium_carterae.1